MEEEEQQNPTTQPKYEHQLEGPSLSLKRNKTVVVVVGAIVMFCVALISVIVIAVVVSRRDGDGTVSPVGEGNNQDSPLYASTDNREDGIDVQVSFAKVRHRMDNDQLGTFLAVCTSFFTINAPGLVLKSVLLVSQKLASLPESLTEGRNRDLQAITAWRSLEAVIRLVPGEETLQFSAQDIAELLEQEQDELIFLLQQTSIDIYFDTVSYVSAIGLSTLAPSPAPSFSLTGVCNGLESLCDKRVNEVVFPSMHEATNNDNAARLLPNHDLDLLVGLDAGIRGLQMNLGYCAVNGTSVLSFVNDQCILGFSDAVQVLTQIQAWLKLNREEVIIMPIRLLTFGDESVGLQDLEGLVRDVVDSDGVRMVDRMYQHEEGLPWPTLQEMVDANQRILLFIYDGPETCNDRRDCPRGFHDWFAYAAETSLELDSVQTFREEPCAIARGATGTMDFFAVNMVVSPTKKAASAILNEAEFLNSYLTRCTRQNGMEPNLVLVDFWSIGDTISVVNRLNGGSGVVPSLRTQSPTANPTQAPTSQPIRAPVRAPVTPPVQAPVTPPVRPPVARFTFAPTASPTTKFTPNPTPTPTSAPTLTPTAAPTGNPTSEPTREPTREPTNKPTSEPTNKPTREPTREPTTAPTHEPTLNPTIAETESPTSSPTREPTSSPTREPTSEPTLVPTARPTSRPWWVLGGGR